MAMGLTQRLEAAYKDRSVLVTGHTGFKGAWLAEWLLQLGAKVSGISNTIPTHPSLFEELGHAQRLSHKFIDIRDRLALERETTRLKPDVIFHLAAQALVRPSYAEPLETFETNVMGTLNLLEIARIGRIHPQAIVVVTSDKCYENLETGKNFSENDPLGGRDPYSASKACAEIATHSYMQSFFKNSPIQIATGRAGNVIGGGDWAVDRLIPDCIRALRENREVEIRSPKAVRPWQHVLEPLSGYLILGEQLLKKSKNCHLESFNFGPPTESEKTVGETVGALSKILNFKVKINEDQTKHEAGLLKLNHEKAKRVLGWHPRLGFEQTLQWTAEGYQKGKDLLPLQIRTYSDL